jgi:hypothetical protein
MLQGRQQPGVEGGKAGQLFGIVAIVLRFALGDGGDLARIGHHHLVAELLEQPAHPGRVGAALQSDAQARRACEMPPERSFGASHTVPLHHFALPVEQA